MRTVKWLLLLGIVGGVQGYVFSILLPKPYGWIAAFLGGGLSGLLLATRSEGGDHGKR